MSISYELHNYDLPDFKKWLKKKGYTKETIKKLTKMSNFNKLEYFDRIVSTNEEFITLFEEFENHNLNLIFKNL
jgi:predicted nucleotidyltransferase